MAWSCTETQIEKGDMSWMVSSSAQEENRLTHNFKSHGLEFQSGRWDDCIYIESSIAKAGNEQMMCSSRWCVQADDVPNDVFKNGWCIDDKLFDDMHNVQGTNMDSDVIIHSRILHDSQSYPFRKLGKTWRNATPVNKEKIWKLRWHQEMTSGVNSCSICIKSNSSSAGCIERMLPRRMEANTFRYIFSSPPCKLYWKREQTMSRSTGCRMLLLLLVSLTSAAWDIQRKCSQEQKYGQEQISHADGLWSNSRSTILWTFAESNFPNSRK